MRYLWESTDIVAGARYRTPETGEWIIGQHSDSPPIYTVISTSDYFVGERYGPRELADALSDWEAVPIHDGPQAASFDMARHHAEIIPP